MCVIILRMWQEPTYSPLLYISAVLLSIRNNIQRDMTRDTMPFSLSRHSSGNNLLSSPFFFTWLHQCTGVIDLWLHWFLSHTALMPMLYICMYSQVLPDHLTRAGAYLLIPFTHLLPFSCCLCMSLYLAVVEDAWSSITTYITFSLWIFVWRCYGRCYYCWMLSIGKLICIFLKNKFSCLHTDICQTSNMFLHIYWALCPWSSTIQPTGFLMTYQQFNHYGAYWCLKRELITIQVLYMHQVTSNMEFLCVFVFGMSDSGPSADKLDCFIYNQDRGAQEEKEDEVENRECLSLEDCLQWREVDDQHLAEQRPTHCIQKHVVGQKSSRHHWLGLFGG